MVQGIASIGAGQPQEDSLPQKAVQAIGQGLNTLDQQEIEQLRELQDELSQLSPDKLKVLEQIIQFLRNRSDRYDDAVKMLVDKGILEPGDLPPDYVPAFFSILEQMIRQAMSGQPVQMARGGLASMRKKAAQLQRAGTGGDKILAHINPREAAMLQATRGGGRNPYTGLPEYGFFDDIGNFLKQAAPVILPVALNFMVPGLGAIASGAIGAGVGALINGASAGDALKAAAMGGIGGAVFSGVQGMMQPGGTFMGGVEAGLPGAAPYTPAASAASAASTPTVPSAGSSGLSQAQIAGQMGRAGAAGQGVASTATAAAPGMLDTAKNWIAANPLPAVGIAGLGGLALASAMQPDQQQASMGNYKGPSEEEIQRNRFPAGSFEQRVAPKVNVVPTYSPAYPEYYAAKGGVLDARVGGHLKGPGTGTSDSIPAKLSDGEFVMTAKAVRGAGGGSREEGARKMYALMHQFEKRA